MTSRQQAGAAVAGLAVLGSHAVGLLRPLEETFSPGLARASWNLFSLGAEAGLPAAKAALSQMLRGSSGEQAAARAGCAVLIDQIASGEEQSVVEQVIYQRLDPAAATLPGIEIAVDKVATHVVALHSYPSAYRDLCLTRY